MLLKPIYLVVTPFFPSNTSFRGPYIYDQVRAIERSGKYRVVVMMGTSWLFPTPDYEYEGVKVNRFKLYDLPSDVWPGSNTWLSLRSFDKALKRLNIKYENIAVVHAHVTGNARFANHVKSKNSKCLTVLQHHGYDVLGLLTGRYRDKEWHKKQAIRYGVHECNKIDLHIGVSQEVLRYLEEFDGIRLKDKYVLYNGVDTKKFYQKQIRADYTIQKPFTIGCVANFWELKDQITLIKAVEILIKAGLKNIKVSFVGTGYTRVFCEHYVEKHGLSSYFEFNNEVDHTQLNAYYNTLDLFVLPSYWDSFGCVYVEAYACGVPFMTARGTGITELIPQKYFEKWVIEPHDYEALAKNIKKVFDIRLSAKEIQPLNSPIEINELVRSYLDYISK